MAAYEAGRRVAHEYELLCGSNEDCSAVITKPLIGPPFAARTVGVRSLTIRQVQVHRLGPHGSIKVCVTPPGCEEEAGAMRVMAARLRNRV